MTFLSVVFFLSLSLFGVYGQDSFVKRNKCRAERREPWSYRGLNGPPFWGLRYPKCYRYQQSPIDIITTDAEKDENLAKLDLNNYEQPMTQGKILNNGHTIQVQPQDGVNRTISVNGIDYNLAQLHFHWGDTYDKGSEHKLDGTQYAMEMHLVHTSGNKIAVVGIFFQEKDDDNEELQKLVDEFPNVKYKGDESTLQSSINLNNLLPQNPTTYYRYQGSLTTPDCSEGVAWSVVPDPIAVGRAQMKKFREELYTVEKEKAEDSCKLVNNYRPIQPLLRRQVFVSQ